MRNFFIFLVVSVLSIILSVPSFAQAKEMSAAVKKGRLPNEMYHCDFKRGIDYRDYSITRERLNGIILFLNVRSDIKKTYSFDFLPIDELDDYIYNCIKPFGDVPFSSLSELGEAWVFRGIYYKEDFNTRDDHWRVNVYFDHLYRDTSQLFLRCKNVHWDGDLMNGLLEGEGSGFVQVRDPYPPNKGNWVGWGYDDAYRWVSFHAIFKNGFPVGNVEYHWFEPASLNRGKKDITEKWPLRFEPFVDGKGKVRYGSYYAWMDEDGFGFVEDYDAIARREQEKKREEVIKNRRNTIAYHDRPTANSDFKTITYIYSEPHTEKDRQEVNRLLDKYNLFESYLHDYAISNEYNIAHFIAGELYSYQKTRREVVPAKKEEWRKYTKKMLSWVEHNFKYIAQNQELKNSLLSSCKSLGLLESFFNVYHDYGTMSPEEIHKWDRDFMLKYGEDYYSIWHPRYFPKDIKSAGDPYTSWLDAYIEMAEETLKNNGPYCLSQEIKIIFEADAKAKQYREKIDGICDTNPTNKSKLASDLIDILDGLSLAATSDTTTFKSLIKDPLGYNNIVQSSYTDVLDKSLSAVETISKEKTELGHLCKKRAIILKYWSTYVGAFIETRKAGIREREKGQQVKTKSRQDILGMIVSKSGWKENGTGYKEQVIKFRDGKEITIYYDKESGMYGKMAERILGTKDWYSTFEEAVVQAYWWK